MEQQLSDDAALLTAYRDHFGIILDRVPAAAPSQAGTRRFGKQLGTS